MAKSSQMPIPRRPKSAGKKKQRATEFIEEGNLSSAEETLEILTSQHSNVRPVRPGNVDFTFFLI
jgi:hypothetical protein